jgi:transposase
MPGHQLTDFLLLPKLKLAQFEHYENVKKVKFHCTVDGNSAFCPSCGMESSKVHDRRVVSIKDAPHGSKQKLLIIKKRRFRCEGRGCRKVFTEQVDGIMPRARLTERMQRSILYICNNFANMKAARSHLKVGTKTIYKRHYAQLDLKWRERKNDVWPSTIGIDEHSFIRNKKYGHREFVTMVVDYSNKRLKEVLPTRTVGELQRQLNYIPGRENVKNVCMDMSTAYRSFAKDYFPNAKIIADKFHVVRLPMPALQKYLRQVKTDTKEHKLRRKLLLKNSFKLDRSKRAMIYEWLELHPEIKEIYLVKETILKAYRCENAGHARRILIKLTDALAFTKLPELKSLRKTLMSWMNEILNYFENKLTNARTEGYNNVAKQVQKRAYGFRNFNNYRLKLLYACQ